MHIALVAAVAVLIGAGSFFVVYEFCKDFYVNLVLLLVTLCILAVFIGIHNYKEAQSPVKASIEMHVESDWNIGQ